MPNDQQPNGITSGPYRRDLMKALGAGTAVGLLGGVASADEHDDEQSDDDSDDTGTEQETPEEATVHVVQTMIGQSTNPERPADFFFQPTGLHIEPGDVIKFSFVTPDHTVTSYHPAFGMQRRVPSGVQPFSSPIMGWDPQSLPDDAEMPPAEPGGETEGEEAEEEDGDDSQEEDEETEGESQEETAEQEGPPQPSSWLHSFETPGVYDIECAPHEGFGMAMRVVVGDETETAFETSNPEELPPPRAGPVGFARQVLTDPNLEPDAIVEEERVEWRDLETNEESEAEGGDEGDENGDS